MNKLKFLKPEDDIFFMQKAINMAQKAYKVGEVPVGAVIINFEKEIISEEFNKIENSQFAGSHAEVLAIKKASEISSNWRLNKHILYVTLEPCPMCMGLSILSRLAGIRFGAYDSRFGSAGSFTTFHDLPNTPHTIDIKGGIEEDKCKELLQIFFREVRQNKKTKDHAI